MSNDQLITLSSLCIRLRDVAVDSFAAYCRDVLEFIAGTLGAARATAWVRGGSQPGLRRIACVGQLTDSAALDAVAPLMTDVCMAQLLTLTAGKANCELNGTEMTRLRQLQPELLLEDTAGASVFALQGHEVTEGYVVLEALNGAKNQGAIAQQNVLAACALLATASALGRVHGTTRSAATESSAPQLDALVGELPAGFASFEELLNQVHMIFGIISMQGEFMRCNKRLVEMLEYTWDEFKGINLFSLLHPDDRILADQLIPALSKGEMPLATFDCRLIRRSGGEAWLSMAVAPIRDSQGNAVAFIGAGTDITERKHVEQALRDSEERYLSVYNNALEIIYVHDLEGRFMDANAQALRTLGYDRSDIANLTIADVLPPEQLETARAEIINTIMRGSGAEIKNYRARCKDGSWRELEVSGASLMSNGQPVAILGLARDVTERHQAEQALRFSEERLRKYFEHGATGMLIAALDLKLMRVNLALCDLLGYTQDELLGTDLPSLIYPVDIADDRRLLKQVLQGELQHYKRDERLLHRDGHTVWVHANLTLIKSPDGKPQHFIGQIIDISERKRYEEEREKLIVDLSQAIAEIETLHGLLPICASCKRIRDDQGYWTAIDQYLTAHSDISFTHSLCPDCGKELYPDLYH